MDNSRSVFIVFCDEFDVWEDDLLALADKPFLVVMIKKDDDPDEDCKKVREKILAKGMYTDILSWHGEAPDFNDDIFGNFIERRIRKDIERKGSKCPDMRVVLWARRKSYFSLVKMIFKNKYAQVSYSRNILESAINGEGDSSESKVSDDDSTADRAASNEKETKTGKKNTRDFFEKKRGDTSKKHEDPYAQYIGNAFSNISSVGENLFETKNISEVEACTIKRGATTSSVANIAAGFFGMGSPFKNKGKKKNKKPEDVEDEPVISNSEIVRDENEDDVLSKSDPDIDIDQDDLSDGSDIENTYFEDEYNSDESEYLDSDCYEDDPEGLYDFPYSDEEDIPYVDTYMSEDRRGPSGKDDRENIDHNKNTQDDGHIRNKDSFNGMSPDYFTSSLSPGKKKTSSKKREKSDSKYKKDTNNYFGKDDDKYFKDVREDTYREPDIPETDAYSGTDESDRKSTFETGSQNNKSSFDSVDEYFHFYEKKNHDREQENVNQPRELQSNEDEVHEDNSEKNIKSKKRGDDNKPGKKTFSKKLKNMFGSQKRKKQDPDSDDTNCGDGDVNDSESGYLDGIYHSKNYKSVKNTENGVYVDSLDDAKAALSYFLIENFIITVEKLKKGVVLDHNEAFEMIMLMLKTSDREVFNKSWTMMSDVTVRFSDTETVQYNILRERAIYYYSVSSVLYYPRQGQMIKDLKNLKS